VDTIFKCLDKGEVMSNVGDRLNCFPKNKKLFTQSTHVHVYKTVNVTNTYNSILYNGSKSWTINNGIHRQMEATGMWFMRRMMTSPWTTRISNGAILKQVNEERRLIRKMRER
jgi:hypothetical protein